MNNCMVDSHKEGGKTEKRGTKNTGVSISEETETLGGVCRGTVTELADESRVSEKQSTSTAGTGIPTGIEKEKRHTPSYLPNC